jgi:hypothetical protein
MKSIYVVLLTAWILFGCKKEEKWGCDSRPYKTVRNVEAKLYFGELLDLKEYGDNFAYCNIAMVPNEIILISEEAGGEGIDVIVSGDLHKGRPPQSLEINPSLITLTEIKLLEK